MKPPFSVPVPAAVFVADETILEFIQNRGLLAVQEITGQAADYYSVATLANGTKVIWCVTDHGHHRGGTDSTMFKRTKENAEAFDKAVRIIDALAVMKELFK